LAALYDDAKLRSMIDGAVGKVLVSPGSVMRQGEPMIEIVGASLLQLGSDRTSLRSHLSARLRALPPERE
jgi:hypothetical protein